MEANRGLLTCESGVTLGQVLDLIVPKGWFLPVTPGTKFVTVGGAIANDVHGKNHHRVGTFAHFVRRFELVRSDGCRMICSRGENAEWFTATVGGLGLTGLITWAELELRPIHNPWLASETIRFFDLGEFISLAAESERDYEYTVAWVDCTDRGASGRGLFMRANHAPERQDLPAGPNRKRAFRVSITPPFALFNRITVPLLSRAYFWTTRTSQSPKLVHYDAFFYPLDSVLEWNRLYGRGGFLQYQCVVPQADAKEAVGNLLSRIAQDGTGSFLTVLKTFGDRASDGLLSFPRRGVTLALDFPISGKQTFDLLAELDQIVTDARGAVYPAKDARMSSRTFHNGFPQVQQFSSFVDPAFSSSFWRRMGH
jgi:FAD/FMN-containing dehydrogenase